MVISHTYRYLFLELPHTGTTSIAAALVQHCDGTRVLHRHASYTEFVRTASPEEKKYFVFSCIRNPLDEAVSGYLKFLRGFPKFVNRINKSKGLTRVVGNYRLRRIDFVRDAEADFSSYFLKFYKLPYDNWSAISHDYCDYVIRFEHLQEDFSKALKLIGIQKEISLPRANKTTGKQENYLSLYNAKAIKRAKYVFGPYMKKWGYEFPPEWGATNVSWQTRREHEVINVFRKLYWQHLRPFAARWAHPGNGMESADSGNYKQGSESLGLNSSKNCR